MGRIVSVYPTVYYNKAEAFFFTLLWSLLPILSAGFCGSGMRTCVNGANASEYA